MVQASAEQLPLADASVDAITSNVVLNLLPDKRRALAEMFRVVKPGGRLQLADVEIHWPVSVDSHEDPRLWVECVVGGTVKAELLALFEQVGFESIEVVGRHDSSALSSSAQTREDATSFGAHAIEIGMGRGKRTPSLLRQARLSLDPRRWLRLLQRRGLLGVAALLDRRARHRQSARVLGLP